MCVAYLSVCVCNLPPLIAVLCFLRQFSTPSLYLPPPRNSPAPVLLFLVLRESQGYPGMTHGSPSTRAALTPWVAPSRGPADSPRPHKGFLIAAPTRQRPGTSRAGGGEGASQGAHAQVCLLEQQWLDVSANSLRQGHCCPWRGRGGCQGEGPSAEVFSNQIR